MKHKAIISMILVLLVAAIAYAGYVDDKESRRWFGAHFFMALRNYFPVERVMGCGNISANRS